jgi:hypothetical protein
MGALLRCWAIDFGLAHVLSHPDESRAVRTAVGVQCPHNIVIVVVIVRPG